MKHSILCLLPAAIFHLQLKPARRHSKLITSVIMMTEMLVTTLTTITVDIENDCDDDDSNGDIVSSGD